MVIYHDDVPPGWDQTPIGIDPTPACEQCGTLLLQPEGIGLDGVCSRCQPQTYARLLRQLGFVEEYE